MLIKNLIFYPQITFFINIVVFCSFSRFGFPTSGSGYRPLRLGVSHASHTHKTPAFRWRQSGFLRLRLHDMVLILPILLYTFLHGIFKLDCQHFFRQIFLGYFSDIVQAFDTLRKNVCGDDYTSLHNPIVLSSVLPAYGMFHSIQILFL